MARITSKTLESLVARINDIRGVHGIGELQLSAWSPGDGWTRYTVETLETAGGAVSHASTGGNASECYAWLQGVLWCLYDAK